MARPLTTRLRRWLVEGLVVVALVTAIGLWQTRHLVASGEPLPPVDLRDLRGERHTSDAWRGRPTLLVLWAPWCGVCGAESDNVSRVRRWLGDRVNVVSIALDASDRAEVERFVADHDVDYPVLLGDAATARAFRVSSYPTAYVVDAEGRVEHTVAGYTTTLGLWWRLRF